MPIVEFKMPKMGESISEATIINWTKKVGDLVEAEETLVEVAPNGPLLVFGKIHVKEKS